MLQECKMITEGPGGLGIVSLYQPRGGREVGRINCREAVVRDGSADGP